MLVASYDKQQEEEADWLSGTLLLPRDALVSVANMVLGEEETAVRYGVSISMLRYRMNVTAVRKRHGQ